MKTVYAFPRIKDRLHFRLFFFFSCICSTILCLLIRGLAMFRFSHYFVCLASFVFGLLSFFACAFAVFCFHFSFTLFYFFLLLFIFLKFALHAASGFVWLLQLVLGFSLPAHPVALLSAKDENKHGNDIYTMLAELWLPQLGIWWVCVGVGM